MSGHTQGRRPECLGCGKGLNGAWDYCPMCGRPTDGSQPDIAAVTEQDDGSYVIQLMVRCDPEADPHGDGAVDPHGDGAVLEREIRVQEVLDSG